MKRWTILLILILATGVSVFAAETPASNETDIIAAKPLFLFQDVVITGVAILLLVATLLVIYQVSVMRMQMAHLQKIIATKDPKAVLDDEPWFEKFKKKFIGLKPLEMEGELIMEEHEYDGIVELKNGMPPWLQAFFAITIVFALSYWIYYMVLKAGPDQYQEYQIELDEAKKDKEERNKLFANSIDENNVELSTNETDLLNGEKIFIDNCATCHKDHGGGDSGPNLTDQYWIHGGGIKNLFKTIKIGFIEKGMPSWQDKLNPLQIKQVASFVVSLQNTHPTGAKAPQGELWVGEVTSADSTAVPVDSLKKDTITIDTPVK